MGRIFAIKRFEIHDGPGIRTTVFFQGCPLSCKWCHNPEGMKAEPILGYTVKRCVNCGNCSTICKAHHYKNHIHSFHREDCVNCGKCESACTHNALCLYGKEKTADELMPRLLEDKPFYDMACGNDFGGVTISGGEPMMQTDFALSLLKLLKKNDIRTAVDTCGFAKTEDYLAVMPYTDIFLFDIKAISPLLHKELTGLDNALILKNLEVLHDHHARIEIRVPYIPDGNACDMEQIAAYISDHCPEYPVKPLAYHHFAVDKYRSLDIEYPMKAARVPDEEEMGSVLQLFTDHGLSVVR